MRIADLRGNVLVERIKSAFADAEYPGDETPFQDGPIVWMRRWRSSANFEVDVGRILN